MAGTDDERAREVYVMSRDVASEVEAAGKRSRSGAARKVGMAAIPVVLAVRYMQMDESKKRFVKHLAKQVPYLPGRYYA